MNERKLPSTQYQTMDVCVCTCTGIAIVPGVHVYSSTGIIGQTTNQYRYGQTGIFNLPVIYKMKSQSRKVVHSTRGLARSPRPANISHFHVTDERTKQRIPVAACMMIIGVPVRRRTGTRDTYDTYRYDRQSLPVLQT